jgi:hypothetical protein
MVSPSPPLGGEVAAKRRMSEHAMTLEEKTLIRPAATFSQGEKADFDYWQV